MDVCLATLRFHPVYAGPAIRFRRYAPGLAARGVQMRVFSAALEEEVPPGRLLPPEQVDDIHVQRVSVCPGTGHSAWRAYMVALTDHLTVAQCKTDVLQLLGLWSWSFPWLWRIRRAKIPIVYTHTMMETRHLGAMKATLARMPFHFVDRVVVSSTAMLQELESFGVKSSKIEVIPNGVDVNRFHPVLDKVERTRLRKQLGLDPHAEVVVFVGGFLTERKGVDLLAEAWKKIAGRPEAQLLLVGPHFSEQRPRGEQVAFLERVRGLLAASGAEDRVHFTGRVDSVENYFQASDVFVFPSRKEGMPNVVLEALACGLPSVLTPFDGMSEEFGRPGEHFLLVERNADALAKAVIDLLTSADRRTRLGISGRNWVVRELNVDRSLDRYATLYGELAGRRKGYEKRPTFTDSTKCEQGMPEA